METFTRCLNCRTVADARWRFCFVCGTEYATGAPPARRGLLDSTQEAEGDSKKVSASMLVLGGLTAIGIARSIMTHFPGSWQLAALFAIGGIGAFVWAAKARSEATTGQIVLGVFGTLVVVLLGAAAIVAGGYLLLLVACKALIEAFGGK